MKTILTTTLAGVLALGFATVAQAQSAQVPTPANPYPTFAIATDGSPLPSQSDAVRTNGGVFSGRSAAVGGPLGFVGGVVGTGLNTAGSVVGDGFGAADAAVGGVVR